MDVLQDNSSLVRKLFTDCFNGAELYVPSVYNYILETDQTVLANMLYRCIVILDDADKEILNQKEILLDYNACSESLQRMIQLHILVPKSWNELNVYLELYDLEYILKLKRKKRLYKIFTTTACNARCFYCFEQGVEVKTMSASTCDALFEYIMRTKGTGNIVLYWFGGEPLCNHKVISQLCSKLRAADVSYTSFIVTNGLLFSKDLVSEAKELWNLKKCQITLDGMHDVYKERKKYKGNIDNPLEIVLNNIEHILQSGIYLSIRLNVDEGNFDSIMELRSLLSDRFGNYKNLSVYSAAILDNLLGYDTNYGEEKNHEVLDASLKVSEDIEENHLMKKLTFKAKLPVSYCMANSTATAIVSPDGKLYPCQDSPGQAPYGDIWSGVTDCELYDAWTHNNKPEGNCKNCVFLPECTAFNHCPSGRRNCFSKRNKLLQRKIEGSYRLLLKNRNSFDTDSEQNV